MTSFWKGTVLATLVMVCLSGRAFAVECDSPPLSDAQVRNTYQVFEKLLHEGRAEQEQAWEKVRTKFKNVDALLAYARNFVGTNLPEQLRQEHEYRREYQNACYGGDPNEPLQLQCKDAGIACFQDSDCCSGSCYRRACD